MGESKEPQKGFGRALKKARSEAELTQKELARRAELDPSQVSEFENGKGNPRWGTARRMAGALGVTLDELAGSAEEFEKRLGKRPPA